MSTSSVLDPVLVSSHPSNQAIVERMLAHVRGVGAPDSPPPSCSAFTIDDFEVTYPNNEVIAIATVTAAPVGVTVLGAIISATTDPVSLTNYCLGVASNSTGLPLPLSITAASTSASPNSTQVTGMLIIAYSQNNAPSQLCFSTKEFTIPD